jgi:hypothetical protein
MLPLNCALCCCVCVLSQLSLAHSTAHTIEHCTGCTSSKFEPLLFVYFTTSPLSPCASNGKLGLNGRRASQLNALGNLPSFRPSPRTSIWQVVVIRGRVDAASLAA